MIDQLGAIIKANLVVFVALILLPMKWIVVRVLRDPEAEAVALMSVPEDICYVALGLVMGDMVSNAGAFSKHFAGSQNAAIDKGIAIGANLFVAIFVHRLSQSCSGHFKQWRAAQKALNSKVDPSLDSKADPRQRELQIPNSENNMNQLMIRYLFFFSIGYAIQLVVVLLWLNWVAKVVAEA